MEKGKGGERAVRKMIKMERKTIMAGSRGSGIKYEYYSIYGSIYG